MTLPSTEINELAKRCTGEAFCLLAGSNINERVSLYVFIPTTYEYDLITEARGVLRDFVVNTVGVHAVAPEPGRPHVPEAFVALANYKLRP
jgi:hypothetical protein